MDAVTIRCTSTTTKRKEKNNGGETARNILNDVNRQRQCRKQYGSQEKKSWRKVPGTWALSAIVRDHVGRNCRHSIETNTICSHFCIIPRTTYSRQEFHVCSVSLVRITNKQSATAFEPQSAEFVLMTAHLIPRHKPTTYKSKKTKKMAAEKLKKTY